MERTIIMYHGGCNDGFGGAYAAWKKFGDTAEYVPLSRSDDPPFESVQGATVYFIDFCYDLPTMEKFIASAARVIMLDHHEGVEPVIRSMPEYVYDDARSGAGIAWEYFHPGQPLPKLLAHVQDDDLFQFLLPDTRPIMTYLEIRPHDFLVWDEFAHKLDDQETRATMLERANIYWEYFQLLAENAVDHAKLVSFEGHEVYFANSDPVKSMRSLVGNLLARKKGPFGLVVSAHPEGYGVSIRGDGSINVAEIAQKYGGNGHPSSAGFLIPRTGPFPWEHIKETDVA